MIFSLTLLILGGLMLRSLHLMGMVERAAKTLGNAPLRYSESLSPEDLIRIGAFLQLWFPAAH